MRYVDTSSYFNPISMTDGLHMNEPHERGRWSALFLLHGEVEER